MSLRLRIVRVIFHAAWAICISTSTISFNRDTNVQTAERSRQLFGLRLEKSGLSGAKHDDEAAGMFDFADSADMFSQEHGQMVNRHYSFLNSTSFKALKGPEKENVTKLSATIKSSGAFIASAFIFNDLLPYLRNMATAFKHRKTVIEPLLTDKSCLAQLQPGILGTGHGSGNIIEIFKEFSAFAKEMASAAGMIFSNAAEPLESQKAQAWVRRWQNHSASLINSIQVFEQTPDGSNAETETLAQVKLATH